MKDQFDVWRYRFPEKGGEHPGVLISHPDICARCAVVMFCSVLLNAKAAAITRMK